MTSCIVCGGRYRPAAIPGLVRCGSCGFISADMLLSTAELKRLYSAQYFAGEEYRNYLEERPIIEKHFDARLNKLLQYLPNPDSKHLLEIGCAYGFFLTLAKKVFATVEGVDISADAISYARREFQLRVAEIDFLEYFPENSINVICMWDTLEHVQSPHAYIKKATSLLGRGGFIAITTGDIDSIVARMRGAQWRQIHPPTHLHYFSKRTLANLLERHGFKIRYAGSDGQYRSLDTIAYGILMIKHKHSRLYHALKNSGLLRVSLYLNLYDIMYVIAEKGA